MIKKLKQFVNYSIFSSILFIILGGLMALFPELSLSVFSYFIAMMGIIFGIYLIILDIMNRNNLIPIDTLISGILLLIFGILLFMYPGTLNMLIPIVLGIWFIVSGVNQLKISGYIKEVSNSSFILTILCGIISIICGVVFIFNPLTSSSVVTMVSGMFIIIFSISNIVDAIVFKRHIKKIGKEIEKRIKIISEA